MLWADGGGVVKSALNPIFGAERVAGFFAGVLQKAATHGEPVSARAVEVNREVALSLWTYGLSGVIAFEWRDGRVSGIRRVSNPAKLTRAW